MFILTQGRLKQLVSYNPETGIFVRIENSTRNDLIGIVAGYKSRRGYIRIAIDGKRHYAHRLAFLYMEGYLPENEVDHINGIKNDNRWKNLREISRSCNIHNTGNKSTNTSGVKGVCFNNMSGKWNVTINGKYVGISSFMEEAICLRFCAEQCLGVGSCNVNSPANIYVNKHIQRRKKQ